MELAQIDWLQRATGVAIEIPIDKMPDPPAEDPPLSPQKITEKKTAARDDMAKKANLNKLLAEELRKVEERKQFLLANAARVIDPLKPVLRKVNDIGFEAEQQTKTMGISHKKTVQRDFIAKDGDVSTSGDVRDKKNATLTKGGEKIDPGKFNSKASDKELKERKEAFKKQQEVVRAVEDAYGVLRGLRDELLSETMVLMKPNKDGTALEPGPKMALFTQDEIILEVFDPLVRSKILPDAFIEDAYSRTQAMLDATNELYKQDLTDSTKFTGRGIAAMGKGFVDMASGVCSCVLEATGLINANEVNISAALTGATELAKLAIDTGDAIDTARRTEKFDKKGLIALLDQLPDIAGQIVGAATGDSKLQKVVADSATAGELLLSAAISHNYDDSSKAMGKFLGSMVSSILDGYAIKMENDTSQQSKDDGNRNTAIKDTLGKLLGTVMGDGAPVIGKLIIEGKFAKAKGQFARIFLDAAAQIPTLMTDFQVMDGKTKDNLTGMIQGQTSGLGSDQVSNNGTITDAKVKDFSTEQNLEYDRNSDLQSNQSNVAKDNAKTAGSSIDATVPKDPSPGKQPDTPEQIKAKEELAALKKKFQKEEETTLRDEIEGDAEAELEAFKARMRGDDKTSRNQNTIDKMIADLKRDQAIMSTLIAVGTGGAAIAGKFVSYAAIGTEAIQLAANAKLAYEKMRAAYEFNQNLKDARETASAYGTAIDNFFKNAKFQLTAASINVAMNGVKLIIAAVAAAVPHAAPAVPAAAALSSGVNAVLGGIKQSKLKKSWQVTKMALADPKNRRLGLKARKMNPTLAKYTIAYGAMEEDPIAVGMAVDCGLTEEALKNPTANVAKVKAYLEAKFPDDGTVVGYWEGDDGWNKDLPDPKLTSATLAKLYKVIGEAFPAVGVVPPGPLAGLVAMATKPVPKDAEPEVWLERSELLRELDTAFVKAGSDAAKVAAEAVKGGSQGGKAPPSPKKIAPVFAEFADLAAEQAFDSWAKAQPKPEKETV
jgi:hypothetical protein